MKTTKLFFMAALALMTAACSNNDNDILTPAEQPAKAGGITITAKLAPKSSAGTRAVEPGKDGDNKDIIKATWAVDEHLAILYSKDGNQMADAKITAVDGTTGEATITFTVLDGTPNKTNCRIVYPLAAVNSSRTYVKDAVTWFTEHPQDGTLNANLDVRVGSGTIQTSTPSMTVVIQPAAQFAIFKFTTKNAGGTAAINVKSLSITNDAQKFVITPSTATSELYAALPEVSGKLVGFLAEGSDNNSYGFYKDNVSFVAGKYYQSTLKMAEPIINLASVTTNTTIPDGYTLTGTLNVTSYPVKISIADGATVTLKDATINGKDDNSCEWAGITCNGNATIILEGSNSVRGFRYNYPGIYVPESKTLIIKGTGLLNASSNGFAAGIGGGRNNSCGNIEIQSGTINADGGHTGSAPAIGSCRVGGTGYITISGGSVIANGSGASAGIGSGIDAGCGDITISGGSVYATAGNGAAGIGSGKGTSDPTTCGNISITGGSVTAMGGTYAPGIGSGQGSSAISSCGTITISSTVTIVTAMGNGCGSIGKGSGSNSACGEVTIGGTQYYDGSAYQNNGATYLATNPLTYPAPALSSETITFSGGSGDSYTYAGTDFEAEGRATSSTSGLTVNSYSPMVIRAKTGKTIVKVEFTYNEPSGKNFLSFSSGTFDGDATVNYINASSLTVSTTHIPGVDFGSVKVYYVN